MGGLSTHCTWGAQGRDVCRWQDPGKDDMILWAECENTCSHLENISRIVNWVSPPSYAFYDDARPQGIIVQGGQWFGLWMQSNVCTYIFLLSCHGGRIQLLRNTSTREKQLLVDGSWGVGKFGGKKIPIKDPEMLMGITINRHKSLFTVDPKTPWELL